MNNNIVLINNDLHELHASSFSEVTMVTPTYSYASDRRSRNRRRKSASDTINRHENRHSNYQIGVNRTKWEVPIIKSGHFAHS